MAKFRLQQVLDLRKRREDEMQLRLAAATAARVRTEQACVRAMDEQQRYRSELLSLLAATDKMMRIQEIGRTIHDYDSLIALRRDEVEKAKAFEASERDLLNRALADRKALDKLRERFEERERIEGNRREAVFLDEIATGRAAREIMRGATTKGGA